MYLDYYYTEYPVKQTTSLYVKLSLKLGLLSVSVFVFLFVEKWSLFDLYLFLEIILGWVPNFSAKHMEGGKGSIFSKITTNLKPMLLLKPKTKLNTDY